MLNDKVYLSVKCSFTLPRVPQHEPVTVRRREDTASDV